MFFVKDSRLRTASQSDRLRFEFVDFESYFVKYMYNHALINYCSTPNWTSHFWTGQGIESTKGGFIFEGRGYSGKVDRRIVI